MTNTQKLTRAELLEWVTYLREYPEKQGKTYLLIGSKMCCLGVLAVLQGIPHSQSQAVGGHYFKFPGGGESIAKSWTALAGALAFKLGSRTGKFAEMGMPYLFYKSKLYTSLVEANDRGVPFSVIADHLEAHYPYEGKEGNFV